MNDINASGSQNSSRRGSSSSGLIRLKKISDAEIMSSIQIGIRHMVGKLESEPERDLLVQDFMTYESLMFPTRGCSEASYQFKFLNYAPVAFKCFRFLFNIKTDNYLNSMCSATLRQLEISGSSGSVFYLTYDDAFILKTAQQREAEFLLKLLPGYYLNLTQNPRTLLPKFFGFYCYSSMSRNTRIVVMNNLIPSNILIQQKYDLKGSTSKRKATPLELKKPSPTYKDLDFLEHHPEGLLLDAENYAAFVSAIQKDCRVLESFKIIDYSLLLAVHYVDRKPNVKKFTCTPECNKEPTRGIPAKTATGEKVLLFVGIIDILQSYQFRKRIEHTFKSIIYEKDSISVHRPDFYSQRFQNFLIKTVFRSSAKRKSVPNPSQTPAPSTPTPTPPPPQKSSTQISLESQPTCSDNKLTWAPPSFGWVSTKFRAPIKIKPIPAFLCEDSMKFRMGLVDREKEVRMESLEEEDSKPEIDDKSQADSEMIVTKNASSLNTS